MKKSLIFFLIFSAAAVSQVRLKGRVINDKKEPQQNLTLRFPLIADAVTTAAGEFMITLPEEREYVDVAVNSSKYELLYPIDGKIPVPADLNYVTTIIISEKNSSPESIDGSVKKFEELKDILKEVGTTSSELKKFLEKFIEIESARLEMDKSSLRSALETAEKREEIFTVISPLLAEYELRLNNLVTVFNVSFDVAFVSNSAVKNINDAINEYNPAFDSLFNNQKSWQNSIKNYWGENLSEKFQSASNYAINEIHDTYVYPLNEAMAKANRLIFKIEDDEEAEEEIKTRVKNLLKNLEIRIPIMEEKFNELLNRLQFAEL